MELYNQAKFLSVSCYLYLLTHPYLEVQGSANSNATVTVNNQSTYRKAEFFRKELTVANSAGPVLQGITNVAVLAGAATNGQDIVTTKMGSVLVPKTPEVFTYDADGNLTQDGKWNYTWDAENRLIAMESVTGIPDAARRKLEFAYDHQSRRISKKVYAWDLVIGRIKTGHLWALQNRPV